MATGNVTKTTLDAWLPTHYSPVVQFGLVEKSVMAPLVRRPDLEGLVTFSGKIAKYPVIASNDARDKAVNTAVTYDNNTEGSVTINLDQHKYVARIIEESAEIQSIAPALNGYAMQDNKSISKAVDIFMSALITNAAITQNVSSQASSAAAHGDITDAVIRNAIQLLDEAEAPEEDRFLVISPEQKNALLGIAKFVEADKSNNDTIKTGKFGEIYGVEVLISNNLADTTSVASSSGAAAILGRKNCMLFHKEAFDLVMQRDIGVITEESADHIGIKMVTHAMFGGAVARAAYAVQVRTTDEA
jgi:hypothetical protein